MYELLEEINQIRASHKLILGDFNLPNINWRNNSAADRKSEKFLDTIQRFYWTQHTLEPTRARGTNTPSVLDLIMTEDENNIDNLVYESPLGKSDHCLINFNYNCYSLHNSTSYLKYFFDKGDYTSFNRVFQADWDSAEESGEMDGVGPEELWKIFLRIYYKNLEEHVPSKVISNGGKKWTIPLDTKLREKIREKHRAWRKFMRNKNDENQRAYIKCRNFIRNQTRKIRNNYEKNIAMEAKVNPKKFWSYVKSKTKIKQELPELITTEGTAKSDQEKADALNAFFASVFVKEPGENIPSLESRTVASLQDVDFNEDIILKKMKQLKIGKSPGPDQIHPRVLKECAEAFKKPLKKIFISSFESGKLPEDWKQAEVCAIFKKGSRKSCNNYRPVSLTSIVCKLMESIIRDVLMSYILNNDLLSPKQYGFVTGRSTVLQLLHVLDKWTEALDNGEQIESIYMDFQKAFDTVPHRRLLRKLQSYGIKGKLLRWLQDFLSNRQQKVKVNRSLSSATSILSGIPQGSVLGPMLFIFFINDLPDDIKSEVLLFADDTKLYRKIDPTKDDGDDELQRDLD